MSLSLFLSVLLVSHPPIVDNDVIIRSEGKIISIEERSSLTLPLPGGPFLNVENIKSLLKKVEREVYRKPHNAIIDDNGKIISESIGYALDRNAFTSQVYNSVLSPGENNIEINRKPIYPEVDTEILSQIREKRIGQYLTYFNPSNKERSYNILLAANAINNKVVFPGQTFSFNRVVGRRTINKGYLPAPVIVKGELAEGIGGGICQVSSTLFNAADNSGLKIIERFSHSKSVRYVPPGRDATVSWYGPDFRFTNKYNQPILIKAKVYQGKLFVSIYSSDTINFKPRKIPSASHQLPEEIKVSTEMKNKSSE